LRAERGGGRVFTRAFNPVGGRVSQTLFHCCWPRPSLAVGGRVFLGPRPIDLVLAPTPTRQAGAALRRVLLVVVVFLTTKKSPTLARELFLKDPRRATSGVGSQRRLREGHPWTGAQRQLDGPISVLSARYPTQTPWVPQKASDFGTDPALCRLHGIEPKRAGYGQWRIPA
jgi:hypothetical protein